MTRHLGVIAKLSASLMGLLGAHLGTHASVPSMRSGMVREGTRHGQRFRKKSGGQKHSRHRPHKNMKWIGPHSTKGGTGWVFFRP